MGAVFQLNVIVLQADDFVWEKCKLDSKDEPDNIHCFDDERFRFLEGR